MIFARRGAKCMYGAVRHIIELAACDKNRARGSERNVAVPAFNCIRSYGGRRIVARADNYFNIFIQSEFIDSGLFERPYRLVALIYFWQILSPMPSTDSIGSDQRRFFVSKYNVPAASEQSVANTPLSLYAT